MCVDEQAADAGSGERIVVASRFHGPPHSGNGGYVAGLLAARIDGPAEITLHAPIPIDQPLRLLRKGDRLELTHGAAVVAWARPAPGFALQVPAAPKWDIALAASARGGSGSDSDFHECFVCGRGRSADEALCVFAARVDGEKLTQPLAVAAWIPDPALAGADGYLPAEFLWGALDCPGAVAAMSDDDPRVILTGRMTGMVDCRVRAGERCTVLAWRIGEEGRKLYSGTAVLNAAGRVCARASSVWIVLKD